MTTFNTDTSVEPTYLNQIDIGAGYGVFSILCDGLLPGDIVQLFSLVVSPVAGGAPVLSLSIDQVQRLQGFFSWTSSTEIYGHFTLTAANIATIAAGSYDYSSSLTIIRNGVTLTREIQAGLIAARTASGPVPPLIVAVISLTGGPVSGNIGGTGGPLVATAYDGLGNVITSPGIVWSSSNPLVAQVDQSGTVSFLMPGSTTIIASAMGVQATTTATSFDAAFASPSNMQVAGYLTSDGQWRPRTLTAAWISDLATAATGITKVGTITTGVWQGTPVAVAYTIAQVIAVSSGANITIGGSATNPTVAVSASYPGQTSITTLGTIATGVWQGSTISTTYTTAQLVSLTGTTNRTTIGGTSTAPTVDIASGYVGQASITTLGTIGTGVWNGSIIGVVYTQAQLVSLTGTSNQISIGGTATAPTVAIANTYAGQTSITTLGTIGTGTWQGTTISTTYTQAQVISVGAGTNITIGGTSSAPTVALSAAYQGQASIVTLGTVSTGVWQATPIADTYLSSLSASKLTGTTLPSSIVTSSLTTVATIGAGIWQGTAVGVAYTIAQVISVTASSGITVGGTSTNPTVAIAASYIGQTSITTLGTITAGTWQGTPIAVAYTVAQIASVSGTSNRVAISGTATAPIVDISAAYVGQTSITTLGTITTGVWGGTTIAISAGGTGITTYALGDLLYSSATNTLARLAGSTNATRKWLAQTGTGSVSAAPAWTLITTADVSDLSSAATGITSVGTITTGIWQGTVLTPQYGGTGIANASNETINLGGAMVTAGAFNTAGAFSLTLTATGNTTVTLPTSGTLVNTAVTTLSSLTTVGILTSPHMTGPVIDSGGLTITAGSIGVGGAINAAVGIYVQNTALITAFQYGAIIAPAYTSAATNTTRGILIEPSTVAASFTIANHYGVEIIDVGLGSGAAVTTDFGMYIGAIVAGATNYALYTNTGLVRFGDAVTISANGLSVTNAVAGSDIILSGSPTSVRQIQLGDSSVYGSVGTTFSGGAQYSAYNASQPTSAANSWAQSNASFLSMKSQLDTSGFSLFTAAAGTATGATAAFWGTTPIFNVSPSGVITAGDTSFTGGNVGIGVAAAAAASISIGGALNTGTTQWGVQVAFAATSSAVNNILAFDSNPSTSAAAFTVSDVYHFFVRNIVLGAGSAASAQYGLYVNSLTAATTNYAIFTNSGVVSFGDIVLGGNYADFVGEVRAKGSTIASTGAGLEMQYSGSNGGTGSLLAYDRGAAVYKNVVVAGSTVALAINGNPVVTIDASTDVNIAAGSVIQYTPSGTNTAYLTVNSTGAYAGKMVMQAGGGSAAFGGAINLYGASHATHPGDVAVGLSSGSTGVFRVNSQGLDAGTDYFTVSQTLATVLGDLVVSGGNASIGSAINTAVACNISSTGTTGVTQYGVRQVSAFSSTATGQGYGIHSQVGTAAAAFTMSAGIAFHVSDASVGAGSAITTQYGMYIEPLAAGGTNYAIYTNTGLVRFGDAVTLTSTLTFTTASAIIIPGATSFSFVNHANTANNFTITDGGAATIRGAFGCNGATAQTAAASGGALAAYTTGAFGLDSSAHMQAMYNLVVAMRAAMVANGIMS